MGTSGSHSGWTRRICRRGERILGARRKHGDIVVQQSAFGAYESLQVVIMRPGCFPPLDIIRHECGSGDSWRSHDTDTRRQPIIVAFAHANRVGRDGGPLHLSKLDAEYIEQAAPTDDPQIIRVSVTYR